MKSTVSLSSTDSAVPPLADRFQLYISAKAAQVLSPLKYVVASLVPVADKSTVYTLFIDVPLFVRLT